MEHLPYLIHALQQVGERGVGKQDGRFALQAVEQETAPGSGEWCTIHQPGGSLQALPGYVPDIPPLPEQVRLQFHTPYRALHEGQTGACGAV